MHPFRHDVVVISYVEYTLNEQNPCTCADMWYHNGCACTKQYIITHMHGQRHGLYRMACRWLHLVVCMVHVQCMQPLGMSSVLIVIAAYNDCPKAAFQVQLCNSMNLVTSPKDTLPYAEMSLINITIYCSLKSVQPCLQTKPAAQQLSGKHSNMEVQLHAQQLTGKHLTTT